MPTLSAVSKSSARRQRSPRSARSRNWRTSSALNSPLRATVRGVVSRCSEVTNGSAIAIQRTTSSVGNDERTQARLESNQKLLAERKAEIERLEKELADSAAKVAAAQKEATDLRREADKWRQAVETEKQSAASKVDLLTEARNKAESELSTLRKELADVKNELRQADQKAKFELAQATKEAKETAKKLEMELVSVTTELSQLKQRHEARVHELLDQLEAERGRGQSKRHAASPVFPFVPCTAPGGLPLTHFIRIPCLDSSCPPCLPAFPVLRAVTAVRRKSCCRRT